MKQYTGKQYDDDLTVGTDNYDDSYYTGSVDFFEFTTDDESPISRLKSLILSIDWEITDDILMQFNEELIDLRDIWAGEKINLVYVQALEKISKYIYQKKASSHPSAIKLLLTLYHNLEKIVSTNDLTEEQKKEILLEDIKRFESLKRHIGQHSQTTNVETQPDKPKQQKKTENISSERDLLILKAIVLSIDWEITNQDLNALRQEVVRLEDKFADSRAKRILLQGIGTLAAYIKVKKSNAHADAFKLLHLFYESLEKIVATPRKPEEEKAIVLPAVEKFNAFKTLLGPTIATEAISRDEKETEESDTTVDSITLAPAFADLEEEEVKGFQAEEVAQTLGVESSGNIDNHVESFFTEDNFTNLTVDNHPGSFAATDEGMHKIALQGVNVEADDEDETDGLLRKKDYLAPALSDVSEEEEYAGLSPALEEQPLLTGDEIGWEDSIEVPVDKMAGIAANSSVEDDNNPQTGLDFSKLDRDLVLQGVDVETEADDDSDEEALPLMGGELAPALAANDEVSIYNAAIIEKLSSEEKVDEEIEESLDDFFDEEIASHVSPFSAGDKQNDQIASLTVDSNDEKGQNERSDEEKLDLLSTDDDPVHISAEDIPALNIDMPSEDGQEEDIAAINERLDSFFDLEEDDAQPEEDIFPQKKPETPVGNVPADEKIIPLVPGDIREEVIFELVAEEAPSVDAAYEHGRTNQSSSLPNSSERTDAYLSLQRCVDALGIELDEEIIVSLWREINNLAQNLAGKPLEKTFLRLLSTVTRHIDQYRYDANSEAYVLLQSVCTALNTLQKDNHHRNQDMLLTETHKVLKWQEQILQKLAAKY